MGVSEGLVKAKAFVLQEPNLSISKKIVEDTEVQKNRVKEAVIAAIEQIRQFIEEAAESLGEESEIFETHMMLLDDPDFYNGITEIIDSEKVSAEYACKMNSENLQAVFHAMDDEYLQARAADIADISTRILKILTGIENNDFEKIDSPCIIVARDLTPSETAKIGTKPVMGFLTQIGGRTSHSAIMARSMGIVAVVGAGESILQIKMGDYLLLDGCSGEVIVNPDENTEIEFDKRKQLFDEQRKMLEIYKDKPATTSDGYGIIVEGNVGTVADAKKVEESGGEGIGLFRSEFLFMDRDDLPSEEEQFQAYKQVAEIMKEKPVIIRTLDIGGDKEVPALNLEKEDNPFLGYRAIRICLDREELFMTQLRALLRAAVYGNIKIMFPMISSLKELQDAKVVVEKTKSILEKEGIPFRKDIKVGIMIEVPAAAICADILARESDFFSIGTNDLIQYSCAVDRINEKVSHLYNVLHPGVLRLIKITAEAGKSAGIEVGVCGEMAGMKGMAPILCGLGVTNLSMSASSILVAKSDLAKYTFEDCVRVADKLLYDGHF